MIAGTRQKIESANKVENTPIRKKGLYDIHPSIALLVHHKECHPKGSGAILQTPWINGLLTCWTGGSKSTSLQL